MDKVKNINNYLVVIEYSYICKMKELFAVILGSGVVTVITQSWLFRNKNKLELKKAEVDIKKQEQEIKINDFHFLKEEVLEMKTILTETKKENSKVLKENSRYRLEQKRQSDRLDEMESKLNNQINMFNLYSCSAVNCTDRKRMKAQ